MHLQAKASDSDGALSDWADLWLREDKKAGYVAVTDFERQLFYGFNDKQALKKYTIGRPKQFISLNAFDVDFREKIFSRKAKDLKQLRLIGIDIDQYKLDLTIPEVTEILFDMAKEGKIPMPNLVLKSRGVQVFYDIAGGASPEMAWLTSYITEQFILKLRKIGADSNAKDVSRVMRVPESINERNGATVTPEIWQNKPYTLLELQSYCKPLDRFRNNHKARFKTVKLADKPLIVFYRVNHARLCDFERLIELRNGDFTNKRNVLLYMYAFHQSLVLDSLKDTLSFMRGRFAEVYSRTDKEMSEKEFERTVKSAYKDAERFFEHYKANGYKMIYKPADGIIKPYKTSSVIDKLEITEQEQKALRTFLSPEMKRAKERDRKTKENRKKGIKPIEQYNQERAESKAEKVTRLAGLMEQNPKATRQELADMLGVSRVTLNKYLKVIER